MPDRTALPVHGAYLWYCPSMNQYVVAIASAGLVLSSRALAADPPPVPAPPAPPALAEASPPTPPDCSGMQVEWKSHPDSVLAQDGAIIEGFAEPYPGDDPMDEGCRPTIYEFWHVGDVVAGPCKGRILAVVWMEGAEEHCSGKFSPNFVGEDWDGYGTQTDDEKSYQDRFSWPHIESGFIETAQHLLVRIGTNLNKDHQRLARLRGRPILPVPELVFPEMKSSPPSPEMVDPDNPSAVFRLDGPKNPTLVRLHEVSFLEHYFYFGNTREDLGPGDVQTTLTVPKERSCVLLPEERSKKLAPDLVPIGVVNGEAGPLLGFRDAQHPFLQRLREPGKKRGANSELTTVDPKRHKTVQTAWYWMTPYRRLLQCLDNAYRPILFAEPMVYLYPTIPQEVSVFVGGLPLSATWPRHGPDGWTVHATPESHLTDVHSRWRGRSLFWEAVTRHWSPPDQGWVVPGEALVRWFDTWLPRLGLSPDEAADMAQAWIPRFADTPWVRIGLIPQARLDDLFPLEITPTPDLVHRILLDFVPMDEPIQLKPPELPELPRRDGFVVVEWGGTIR